MFNLIVAIYNGSAFGVFGLSWLQVSLVEKSITVATGDLLSSVHSLAVSTARAIALVLLALLISTGSAWSQSSAGSVRGTVQDASGAVIPNVSISLVNTATGIEQKSVSNDAGIYVFPTVVPGPYKLSANFQGMKPFEATLTVQTQVSAAVDIRLQLAGSQTLVNVEDLTPVLKTDTATMSSTLERARIEQLPINGRNVNQLLTTVPGLTFENKSTTVRVFGTRVGTHDMVLDGAALTDQLYGGGNVTRPPSLDSIQEFHVEVNATSARFPRQASIIMTTKSGTNDIHGSLFETNRNNGYGVARARDNFTNKAAKLSRNEYGGTVGGPVWIPKIYNGKNRTFWFFNYEGYKLRSGDFANYRVPTMAMRQGDFSGLVDSASTFQTIYDPLTTNTQTYARQPFSHGGKLNAIDPNRISPFAKYIYSQMPEPTLTNVNPLIGDNYSAPNPNIQDQYTWGARFDHKLTDNDQLWVRITKSEATTMRPNSGGVPMADRFGNQRINTYPNKSGSVTWARTFSPTWFNEVMFSASRTVSTNFSGDFSRYYTDELGLPNPGHQPGYPIINNIGVGTGSGNYFAPVNWSMQYFNYYILENNGTKVMGKHELQYGFRMRHDQLTYMPQQQRTAGALTFVANTTALFDPVNSSATTRAPANNTGHIAAGFFLGHANYEVRQSKGKYYMRQNEDAVYFQDNFKVTPRLTLKLGVRWQFSPYPSDKYNIFSSFDPKTMSIVLGQPLDFFYKVGAANPKLVTVLQNAGAKFVTYDQVGYPRKLVKDNWFDISPHIGFAYRAFDGPKSFVIRGGYARNYNLIPIYGWNDRMRMNAPFYGAYQNYELSDSAQSPDGLNNYGLVTVPTLVTGKNSANAVTFDRPMGITQGTESFQNAYFGPEQPTSSVHDWNLTMEKEVLRDTVVRAAYVGNYAVDQDSYYDWNAQMSDYVWVATRKLTPPTGVTRNTDLRPNSTLPYGNLQEYRKDGWGWSNGMQLELQRRYSKGIGFQVFYMLMNVNKAAAHGWYGDSSLAPVSSFLPGSIPTDDSERLRLLLYKRDTTVPKHEIRWNWIGDLPFGKGKALAGNANRVLNSIIGGWQISGMGRWRTQWLTLPTTDPITDVWPTGTPVEYYGHKYPIQDCRSGACRQGYLLWNGYIPAHQINSYGANGKPNGVMGVPDNYKPAAAPLWPYPADYRSRTAATDPNYGNYGTNYVWLPVNNSAASTYRLSKDAQSNGSPLHPWIGQAIQSTPTWSVDAALVKNFKIRERFNLRFQVDFFNVFNNPGDAFAPATNAVDGIVPTWTNQPNDPRVMQLSARFAW